MKRKQSIITFNYWPGYVDAMFNVVLSVLLIIGLMVVGLLCLNLEVVKSGTAISQINKISEINQINKLNQQKKIEEEQKLLALLGAFLQSQLDRKKTFLQPHRKRLRQIPALWFHPTSTATCRPGWTGGRLEPPILCALHLKNGPSCFHSSKNRTWKAILNWPVRALLPCISAFFNSAPTTARTRNCRPI